MRRPGSRREPVAGGVGRVGRVSDQHGRIVPLRAGLVASAVALVFFTLPASAPLLAVVIVCTAVGFGFFWAPAMALLSDAGEAVGLDHALGAALMNLAWAGGVIVGSAGGGAIAKASSDAVPTVGAAVVFAVTAAALFRRRAAAPDEALSPPSRAA